jgi:hypothetical protein
LDKKNSIGFDEIAFVNWNAGGTSSVSGLLKQNLIERTTPITTTGQTN